MASNLYVLTGAAGPKKPNVIVLFADDLGYGDLGVQGSTDVATPNLDRLAAEGVRFTDGYANAPVCSPSRVAIMTGRYQQHFGYHAEDYMGGGSPPIPPGEVPTIANYLSARGYRTACYGKWNISGEEHISAHHYGFDHFVGLHHNINYFTHRSFSHENQDYSGPLGLYENDGILETEGYLDDVIADYTIKFIEENAAGAAPFFVYVPWQGPHAPAQAPSDPPDAEAVNSAAAEFRDTYIEIIENLDKQAGRIIDTVDRLGIAEETLIVFLSDNGGHRASDNTPLRGFKQDLFEGGVRVPFILRWTGTLPEGAVNDVPVTSLDVAATAAALAGASVPEEHALDGTNLIPIALGKESPHDRPLFFRRMTTNNHNNTTSVRARSVRVGPWKYLDDVVRGNQYLFNLAEDIGETTNLRLEKPDKFEELQALLTAWEEEVTPEQPHFTVVDGGPTPPPGDSASVSGILETRENDRITVRRDDGTLSPGIRLVADTSIRSVVNRTPEDLVDGWLIQAHGELSEEEDAVLTRQIRVNLWQSHLDRQRLTDSFLEAPLHIADGGGLHLRWDGGLLGIEWTVPARPVMLLDNITPSEMTPGFRVLVNGTETGDEIVAQGIFYYPDRSQ